MLRSAMIDTRAGLIEPAVAQAIASLAKTSVALSHDLELERRLEELERAAGITSSNVTSISHRRTG
jgi:hypothetical protein